MSMDRANRLVSALRSVLFVVALVNILVLIVATMTGAKLTA